MTGSKLRTVVIGAGLQGRRRSPAIKQCKETELVMVVDTDGKAAKSIATELDCEASTDWEREVQQEDIDLVLVCTPPHMHYRVSIAAMKKGKHVLCEKPLARNPEEASEMLRIALANGVKLKCGFSLRHHPGIVQAREWFDKGMIGEPTFVRGRYGIGGRPDYEKEWRAKADIAGGGQLMDQGMHLLDLSRWFLGDFSEAFGLLSTSFWNMAPLEDNSFVLLRTKKGTVASLHASWTQWKNLFSFELFGKDGYVLVENLGGSYGTERIVLGKREFLKPFREVVIEFPGEDRSWYEEWQEFVNAIKDDREPLGNGNDGYEALRLAYAVYESVKTKAIVKL